MDKLGEFTEAAILVEQNKDLIIDKIKLPESLGIGQVFVKLFVSGICGSQIGEITGAKGADPFLSLIRSKCGLVLCRPRG